jgi:hypothetical protein
LTFYDSIKGELKKGFGARVKVKMPVKVDVRGLGKPQAMTPNGLRNPNPKTSFIGRRRNDHHPKEENISKQAYCRTISPPGYPGA